MKCTANYGCCLNVKFVRSQCFEAKAPIYRQENLATPCCWSQASNGGDLSVVLKLMKLMNFNNSGDCNIARLIEATRGKIFIPRIVFWGVALNARYSESLYVGKGSGRFRLVVLGGSETTKEILALGLVTRLIIDGNTVELRQPCSQGLLTGQKALGTSVKPRLTVKSLLRAHYSRLWLKRRKNVSKRYTKPAGIRDTPGSGHSALLGVPGTWP